MATPWDYAEAAAKQAGTSTPASDALNGIIMRMLMNPGEADRYLKGVQAMDQAGIGQGRVDPWELWAANQAQLMEQNQPDPLMLLRSGGGGGPNAIRFADPTGDFLAPLRTEEGVVEMPEGPNLYAKPGSGPGNDIGMAEQAFRNLMRKGQVLGIDSENPAYHRFRKQKNVRGE